MTKDEALAILHKNMSNMNLRRHCYAVGFAMLGIYDCLAKKNNKLLPDREVWEIVGILHDSDYELIKNDWDKHTLLTLKWLKENNIKETDQLYMAIETHNNARTKLREPKTLMELSLECVDELTGFIVACTLVLPSKKIKDLTVQSIKKKWKQPSFARAVDRSQIEQCEKFLNIKLDDFINITLDAMKVHSNELGL